MWLAFFTTLPQVDLNPTCVFPWLHEELRHRMARYLVPSRKYDHAVEMVMHQLTHMRLVK